MLNLDDIAPKYEDVKLGGRVYRMPTDINSMPVAAAAIAVEIGAAANNGNNPTAEQLRDIVKAALMLPDDVAAVLSLGQVKAVFSRMFPAMDAGDANPTTASAKPSAAQRSDSGCGEQSAKSHVSMVPV